MIPFAHFLRKPLDYISYARKKINLLTQHILYCRSRLHRQQKEKSFTERFFID